MAINLDGLRIFNDAIQNAQNLSGNTRLKYDAQAGTIAGYQIKQLPASQNAKDLNRATRQQFAAALTNAFGVESLEKLPKAVLDVLKIEDFKLQDGANGPLVTSTRPLTMRRIRAVMDAVKEVATQGAQSKGDAKEIRDNFVQHLQQNASFLKAALNHAAVAEGLRPLTIRLPRISAEPLEIPLSLLKPYTKGIKQQDLAGKIGFIKQQIEADVTRGSAVIAQLRNGVDVKPDVKDATSLCRYFALCSIAKSGETSSTISVPDEDGKIARFLNQSAKLPGGAQLQAVHTEANPYLSGVHATVRFNVDIGFSQKSDVNDFAYIPKNFYSRLLQNKDFSVLLKRETGSPMALAQMHANVSAEQARLQNEYSVIVNDFCKAHPEFTDVTDASAFPPEIAAKLEKNIALQDELELFYTKLSQLGDGFKSKSELAVRFSNETVLFAKDIPGYSIQRTVTQAQEAAPVVDETALYQGITAENLIDFIVQVQDLKTGDARSHRAEAINDCLEMLPDAMVSQELRDKFSNPALRKTDADFEEGMRVISRLTPRQLYILKRCEEINLPGKLHMAKMMNAIPKDKSLLFNEMNAGVIPLNTSTTVLRAIVYSLDVVVAKATDDETEEHRIYGAPSIIAQAAMQPDPARRVRAPAGLYLGAAEGMEPFGGPNDPHKGSFKDSGDSYISNCLSERVKVPGENGEMVNGTDYQLSMDQVKKEALPHIFLTRAWGFNTTDPIAIVNFVKECGYDPETISTKDLQKLMNLARFRDFDLKGLPAFYARVLHKTIQEITDADMLHLYDLMQTGKLKDPLHVVKSGSKGDLIGLFTGDKLPADTKISSKDMLALVSVLRGFAADGGEKDVTLALSKNTIRIQQNTFGNLLITVDGMTVAAGQKAAGLVHNYEDDMVANLSRYGADTILRMLPALTTTDFVDGGNSHLRELCLRIVSEKLKLPMTALATIPTSILRSVAANALKGHYTTTTGEVDQKMTSSILAGHTRHDIFTGEEVRELYAAMKAEQVDQLNRKVKMSNVSKPKPVISFDPKVRLAAKQEKIRNMMADLMMNADIISYDEAILKGEGDKRVINILKKNVDLLTDILLDPKTELAGLPKDMRDTLTDIFQDMMGDSLTAVKEKINESLGPGVAANTMLKSVSKAMLSVVLDVALLPEDQRTDAAIEAKINGNTFLAQMMRTGVAELEDLVGYVLEGATMMGSVNTAMNTVVSEAMEQIQNTINTAQGVEGDNANDVQNPQTDMVPIWKKSFGELIGGALTDSTCGYGRFMKNVLSTYFSSATPTEGRQILASLFRNTDADSTPAQVLGAIFKGAGPLLQKMLQALPLNAFGDEMADALKDMKSNLQPIPNEIVQAHLFGIVERSNGKILSIEVTRSLGAASVGQAFLCKICTQENPLGEECVVKILRPNIKTIMENERERFMEAARNTPGMLHTFEGQYARILDELDFTKEMTNINYGRSVYEQPSVTYTEGIIKTTSNTVRMDKLHSMELHPLVSPSMECLILKKAEGETYDRYMDKTRGEIREILKGSDGSQPVDFTDPARLREAKTKLAALHTEVRKRKDLLLNLTEKWVQEALYGNGFYHGDLHAGNIMTNGDGLTVIDFGNATHLTTEERTHVLKMMSAAMFGRESFFEDSFLALITPESRQVYKNLNANGKLTTELHELLNKGTTIDAGNRIFAALMCLQRHGIEIPGPIYNFAQCQMRLGGAVDEMNSLLSSIEESMENLRLSPVDVELPPQTHPEVHDNVWSLFKALDNFINPNKDPGARGLDEQMRVEHLKIFFGTDQTADEFKQNSFDIDVAPHLKRVFSNRELFDTHFLPFVQQMTHAARFYSTSRGAEVMMQVLTERGDTLRQKLDAFLAARDGADPAAVETALNELVDAFFYAGTNYVQASSSVGHDEISEQADPNDFVNSIAHVVMSNLQPALKSLGTMAIPLGYSMLKDNSEVASREKRIAKTPLRIRAYCENFLTKPITQETIDTIRDAARSFQHPINMPGKNGKLKGETQKALLLDVLHFNIRHLEKKLVNAGVMDYETTPVEEKNHYLNIAIISFADRIGGIGDAVRKLSQKEFDALLADARELDPANQMGVAAALNCLRTYCHLNTSAAANRPAEAPAVVRPTLVREPVANPEVPAAPNEVNNDAPIEEAPIEEEPIENNPVNIDTNVLVDNYGEENGVLPVGEGGMNPGDQLNHLDNVLEQIHLEDRLRESVLPEEEEHEYTGLKELFEES